MQVDIRGGKVFRDGVLVGAVWPFMGAWLSRVFAEAPEKGSRKFHSKDNALADAQARARALTPTEAAPKDGATVIPKLDAPEAFSD